LATLSLAQITDTGGSYVTSALFKKFAPRRIMLDRAAAELDNSIKIHTFRQQAKSFRRASRHRRESMVASPGVIEEVIMPCPALGYDGDVCSAETPP